MRLKSGMNVRVVSGNHKGKEGKILKILKNKNRVIIEGVNLIKKHTRPTQDNPKGGIVEKKDLFIFQTLCFYIIAHLLELGINRLMMVPKLDFQLRMARKLKTNVEDENF